MLEIAEVVVGTKVFENAIGGGVPVEAAAPHRCRNPSLVCSPYF